MQLGDNGPSRESAGRNLYSVWGLRKWGLRWRCPRAGPWLVGRAQGVGCRRTFTWGWAQESQVRKTSRNSAILHMKYGEGTEHTAKQRSENTQRWGWDEEFGVWGPSCVTRSRSECWWPRRVAMWTSALCEILTFHFISRAWAGLLKILSRTRKYTEKPLRPSKCKKFTTSSPYNMNHRRRTLALTGEGLCNSIPDRREQSWLSGFPGHKR